jgi:hypothetical protein
MIEVHFPWPQRNVADMKALDPKGGDLYSDVIDEYAVLIVGHGKQQLARVCLVDGVPVCR